MIQIHNLSTTNLHPFQKLNLHLQNIKESNNIIVSMLLNTIMESLFQYLLSLSSSTSSTSLSSISQYLEKCKAIHSPFDENIFFSLFTCLYDLVMNYHVREHKSMEEIKDEMIQFNVPSIAIDAILKSINTHEEKVLKTWECKCFPLVQYPHLKDLRWRLELIISSHTIERVMKPVIMMEIKLSNQKKWIMEVSMDQIERLRYETANVLQQMNKIQQHPIMRLVYDESNNYYTSL